MDEEIRKDEEEKEEENKEEIMDEYVNAEDERARQKKLKKLLKKQKKRNKQMVRVRESIFRGKCSMIQMMILMEKEILRNLVLWMKVKERERMKVKTQSLRKRFILAIIRYTSHSN